MPQTERTPEQEPERFAKWLHSPEVITIEGLAATGKGTISRVLCEKYGYDYVSISSIGRGLAAACLGSEIPLDNEVAIEEFYRNTDVGIRLAGMANHISIDEVDVTPQLFNRETSLAASYLMRYQFVRDCVRGLGQEIAGDGRVVFDGRHVANEIAPGSELQLILVASIDERVRRRLIEERLKDSSLTEEDIADDLAQRDANEVSTGAVVSSAHGLIVDTTRYTPEDLVNFIVAANNRRWVARNV